MRRFLKKIVKENKFLERNVRIILNFQKNLNQKSIIKKLKKFHEQNKYIQKTIIDKNLLSLLNHAKNTVPYYDKILKNIDIDKLDLDEFKKIPFLNKQTIKDNFEDLKSNKYSFDKLTDRYTGGSTGNPLKLLSDFNADIIDRAHHIYMYQLFGYKKGDLIIGAYGRNLTEEQIEKNIYWSYVDDEDIFGKIIFSTSYLNEENITIYIEKLLALKPKIIRSYPSFLNRLAIYILDNKIKINFIIKGIVVTSEVCLKQQIDNIKKAFNCNVYLEYGNREITMFSYTFDDKLRYRTSPYYCYFEVLNEDGSDTKVGEIGRVVTTSLVNKGMPFIRYETGDFAKVYSRNSGYMELSSVLGRENDFLIDENRKKIYLLNTIYRTDFNVLNKIKAWQFYQKTYGEVEILIVSENELSPEELEKLKLPFNENGKFSFTINYVKFIPKTLQGKQPFVRKDFVN